MAGRWSDDERDWMRRETRRTDPYGRDPSRERDYGANAYGDEDYRGEDYRGDDLGPRSFSPATGGYGRLGGEQRQPPGPVFGEYQTGADYRRRDSERRERREPERGQGRGEARYEAGSNPSRGGEPRGDGLYREVYGYGARDDLSRQAWEGRRARDDDRERQRERRYEDEGRGQTARPLRDERAYGPERPASYEGRDREDLHERDGRHDQGRNFLDRAAEQVTSWFRGDDRREAPDHREAERRDEGLYRGRGPQTYKRPDERISDEVHERLTEDAWIDASNISVSVSGGEVTLSGTVPEREAKHRAERLVEDLSGVTHVQNNLRVARGGFLTSPERGFGDSVQAAQMAQVDPAARPAGRRTDS